MDTWIECGWTSCRKRFEPGRRGNQHRRADGPQHRGAVYCSRACQQKAYRWRLEASQKTCPGTTPQATVTRGSEHIENLEVFSTKNEHPRPSIPLQDGYVRSRWEPWPPSIWGPIVDRPLEPHDDLSIPAFLRQTNLERT
jgi:hypothetical protein